MKTAIIFALILLTAGTSFASTLDGYDRAAIADENYKLAHGEVELPEAKNDPKLAAVMKKYVEAPYHVAQYIGFPKVFEALEIADELFAKHGLSLSLEKQGTTTDADRFEKGLAFQVGTYGERITQMRDT